ncbi:hypothetical protein CKO44_16725 [Rubrivivax gelatinosus]|uniref:Small Trp-rich protein n=1 Tax=Rubrivivax gelatinosus TaxID=28068 RepID=A0ABS1DWA5_RUBGE|nr:TIGR04438 family Trp-rich protein [Rubrivivax gelatinosus]MBK1615114.1 hypothetical protein [Rubrivivax gelatinosus]MBK1713783.1 hypothetical protein [Rubrivivax gelatinosus]
MWFLIVGLVLLGLYLAGIEPVASWHWLWIALPFGAAAAWWTFADSSGLTRRRAEKKIEDRKRARRQRDIDALGLNPQQQKRVHELHKSDPGSAKERGPR